MALLGSSTTAGLDDRGIQDAVTEYVTLEGTRKGVNGQRRSLQQMYSALIRRDDELTQHDLEEFYVPVDQPNPDGHGRYGEYQFNRFWDDVVRTQLPRLPGVKETDSGYRFVGADPASVDVDEEHVWPLSELRDDPRTDARNWIEDVHGPDTDVSDALLALWDHIADVGETTTEKMVGSFRRLSVEEHTDELASAPHIEREVVEPPAPDEITIKTYQDVLDAKAQVEAEPTEQWHYTG